MTSLSGQQGLNWAPSVTKAQASTTRAIIAILAVVGSFFGMHWPSHFDAVNQKAIASSGS